MLLLCVIFNVEARHELRHQLTLVLDLGSLEVGLLDLLLKLLYLLLQGLHLLVRSLLLVRLLRETFAGAADGAD